MRSASRCSCWPALDTRRASARRRLEQAVVGRQRADELFAKMVAAQGGDAAVIEHPRAPAAGADPARRSRRRRAVSSRESSRGRWAGRSSSSVAGGARSRDARAPGRRARGAGQAGPARAARRPCSRWCTRERRRHADAAVAAVLGAISIGDARPDVLPLIAWRVTAAGATPYGGC